MVIQKGKQAYWQNHFRIDHGVANIFLMAQVVNIFGFLGHTVSVQLLNSAIIAQKHRQEVNEWV